MRKHSVWNSAEFLLLERGEFSQERAAAAERREDVPGKDGAQMSFVLLKFLARLAFVCALLAGDPATAAPKYSYKVIATYPHSTESYTEGFLYLGGIFRRGCR